MMQDLIVVGDDLQQDFGRQIFDVFRLQAHAALMGGEMDDVIDQSKKAINEIVPRAPVMLQASLQQRAIDGGQRHCSPSRQGWEDLLSPATIVPRGIWAE